MTKVRLAQLVQLLAASLGHTSGASVFFPIYRQVLRLLSNGKPVTPQGIGEAIGTSRHEAAKFLRKLPNAELDARGNLVGMGLTLNPTPHKFIVNNRTLYTWCALDALIFPALIDKPAHVESPCPVTGSKVMVDVSPNKVIHLHPSRAMVSLVIPDDHELDVRQAFCENVHFFYSSVAGSQWLVKHPNGVIVSVREAFEVGRMVVAKLLG